MAGSTFPVLIAGSKARASDVEAKCAWLQGNFVPMFGGGQTDGAYDLGVNTSRWRNGFFSAKMMIGMNTTTAGFFQGRNSADVSLMFAGNNSFTTTAVSINAVNDSNSANIPLEIRASHTRITSGDLALAGTTTAITAFSGDGTFAANSDAIVPTQKAVKTYTNNLINNSGKLFAEQALGGLVLWSSTAAINIPFGAVVSDPLSELTTSGYFVASNSATVEFIMNINVGCNSVTSRPFVLSLEVNTATITAFYGNTFAGGYPMTCNFTYLVILQPGHVCRMGFSSSYNVFIDGTLGTVTSLHGRTSMQIVRT